MKKGLDMEREVKSQEQKIPPALQELKKILSPKSISLITDAYERFSDTEKSSLLRKIQENKAGIDTFVELEDDTSLQTLLKKIIMGFDLTPATKMHILPACNTHKI